MIRKLPQDIPRTPGVYFFTNAKGERVYIGKAVNLHNRLRGHPMLEKADRVDWQEASSEIEALILESQLIKKYKPLYTISLRDHKNYVYVIFTDEAFPKIFVGHRDGIGPFTSSTELRAALKALRKLFPYCICKQKHNRLCLNAHIGKCLAACCLKPKYQISNYKQIQKQYLKNIKIIKDILSGEKQAFMKQFPNVFASARVIREIQNRHETLLSLQHFFKLPSLPKRIEGYDISNIQGTYATGSMVVFENGHPNKSEYRKFRIKTVRGPNDTAMLSEMLMRRFNHAEWPIPDLLLIDGGKGQLNAAKSVISNLQLEHISIISIAKGKKEIFSHLLQPLPLATMDPGVRNLILHVDAEAHRFAIAYYRKLHKRSVSGSIKSHV